MPPSVIEVICEHNNPETYIVSAGYEKENRQRMECIRCGKFMGFRDQSRLAAMHSKRSSRQQSKIKEVSERDRMFMGVGV